MEARTDVCPRRLICVYPRWCPALSRHIEYQARPHPRCHGCIPQRVAATLKDATLQNHVSDKTAFRRSRLSPSYFLCTRCMYILIVFMSVDSICIAVVWDVMTVLGQYDNVHLLSVGCYSGDRAYIQCKPATLLSSDEERRYMRLKIFRWKSYDPYICPLMKQGSILVILIQSHWNSEIVHQ